MIAVTGIYDVTYSCDEIGNVEDFDANFGFRNKHTSKVITF